MKEFLAGLFFIIIIFLFFGAAFADEADDIDAIRREIDYNRIQIESAKEDMAMQREELREQLRDQERDAYEARQMQIQQEIINADPDKGE